MNLVFDTEGVERGRRYGAWRDAICNHYVQVDVRATRTDDYRGFIREDRLGEVVLTDVLISEQRIRRDASHIARLDKDCFYLQFVRYGQVDVHQQGTRHSSHAGEGAIFTASEPYELHCAGEVRSLYLELPRAEFATRFSGARIPVVETFHTTSGLGRIASEFCSVIAAESLAVEDSARVGLGEQVMDLLAMALQTQEAGAELSESSVRQVRLRTVQNWIERNLGDPDLTPARIAAANGISLRYLHLLFRACGMSVSEWLWDRRLQASCNALAKAGARSITDIAFDMGFGSASHFSGAFRRKFGISPSEAAGRRKPQG